MVQRVADKEANGSRLLGLRGSRIGVEISTGTAFFWASSGFGVGVVGAGAHWHQFQVLTKRSERLLEMSGSIDWPTNVWMGVSVENAKYKFRVANLRTTGAKIRFLSLEPLIGDLGDLNLQGIDWVIAGGESGPGARPMKPEWVLNIQRQCAAQVIPFFFKQWGESTRNEPAANSMGGPMMKCREL